MSVFDSILNVLRLDDEDEDEFYDEGVDFDDDIPDYGADEDEDEVKAKPKSSRFSRKKNNDSSNADVNRNKQSKITPMRPRRVDANANMEVCVIKPTSIEDSREVIDTLLDGKPVILNTEGIDVNLAQRIIDMTCGGCMALDGKIQKVSGYIFIITPDNVDISGDLQGIMDSYNMSGLNTGY